MIEREGVNVLCQAPTEYRILAKRTELRPIPSLRRMVSAGEPLNPEVIRAFREALGMGIGDGYGQTETGPVTGHAPGRRRSGARRLDGPAAAGDRGARRRRRAPGEAGDRPDLLQPLPRRASPSTGEWWPTGDHVRRGRGRLPLVRGPRRRHHHHRRLPGRARSRSSPPSSPIRPWPRPPPWPRPTRSAARWSGRSWCSPTASPRTSSPPSSRSTSSGSPRPTSTRASSSSPRSCRRRRAARSGAPSCR